MMSTRRPLFAFGALLAVGVLLAPQPASAQGPPTSVTATALSDTEVQVTWTAPANAALVATYEVGYKLDTDTTDTSVPAWTNQENVLATAGGVKSATPDTTKASQRFTVTGLKAATDYAFNVRSVNVDRSTISNWAMSAELAPRVTTDAAPTTVAGNFVSGVTATMKADVYDKLTVEWKYEHTGALSTDDTGFFIYYTKGKDVKLLSTVVQLAARRRWMRACRVRPSGRKSLEVPPSRPT